MNRKSCLGCGGLVLLVIGAMALGVFVVAPRVVQKGKGWLHAQVENAARRSALESAWQPPSQRPEASWFPVAVDAWTLQTSEDITSVPDIQLARPGRHAKYRGVPQDVEVTVVPVAAEELAVVFDRAETALSQKDRHVIARTTGNPSFKIESGQTHVMTRTGSRFYIKLNGDQHTRLWWMKDWLFIFQTTGPEDPDAFAEKYLEAMRPAELEQR